MWAKIKSFTKHSDSDSDTQYNHPERNQSVPNLHSYEHYGQPVFPPSPPGSPSKANTINPSKTKKRFSLRPKAAAESNQTPYRMQIGLPKKVKSQLALNSMNASQHSLARIPTNASRPSESTEPPRPSHDIHHHPVTPVAAESVRSILKDANTPGSGQNVRFFSRDAYKTISPDVSVEPSIAPEPLAFAPKNSRPSVAEIFTSPQSDAPPSLMLPTPPPDLSNLFDMSQDHQPIPNGTTQLLETAVEAIEEVTEPTIQPDRVTPRAITTSEEDIVDDVFQSPSAKQDANRSLSFSFGQSVFQSIAARASGSSQDSAIDSMKQGSVRVHSRARAASDAILQSMLRSSTGSSAATSPEADINDNSVHDIPYTKPEPDPFSTNAKTYYTADTRILDTPPKEFFQHARKTSKEQDTIMSLHTRNTLLQELRSQLEVDLNARDALVEALQVRLDAREAESKERRAVMRSWRKKVQDLERACRVLEDEVDRSRTESSERSMIDEASSAALRELHRRIAGLERERADMVKQMSELEQKMKEKEQSEWALREGIDRAQEEMDRLGHLSFGPATEEGEELRIALAELQKERFEETDKHHNAQITWKKEKEELLKRTEDIARLESEVATLTAELGEQLKRAEEASAREDQMAQERLSVEEKCIGLEEQLQAERLRVDQVSSSLSQRDEHAALLKTEVQHWQQQAELREQQFEELEARNAEYQAEIANLLSSHAELDEHDRATQEQNADLLRSIQERDNHLRQLEKENQFAQERIPQLEAHVHDLNEDLLATRHDVSSLNSEIESLREQLSAEKRAHRHTLESLSRDAQNTAEAETSTREQLEELIRFKIEAQSEIEQLKKTVESLHKESADKEVKIVQIIKGRAQDKEDLAGLNIALDSKQQELELLKRKMGVKGTAGATSASATKASMHRRDSSVFTTPGYVRPGSAMSNISIDSAAVEHKAPPSASARALAKSTRANTSLDLSASQSSKKIGSMGPPPPPVKRASIASPTAGHSRIPSSLSLSASAGTPRKSASVSALKSRQSLSAMSQSDKENNDTPIARRTRARVPVSAS